MVARGVMVPCEWCSNVVLLEYGEEWDTCPACGHGWLLDEYGSHDLTEDDGFMERIDNQEELET